MKRIWTRNRWEVDNLRCAYKIQDKLPNTPAILKTRTWVTSQEVKESDEDTSAPGPVYEVRSYMDYCACGSLQDVLDRYDHTADVGATGG